MYQTNISWSRVISRIMLEVAIKTLRTAIRAIVHSIAEYECCDSAKCRSNHPRVIDKPINDTLRRVTDCLRPISTNNVSVENHLRLLRLSFCTTSQNKPQLQSKGLTSTEIANGKKVYRNFTIPFKT